MNMKRQILLSALILVVLGVLSLGCQYKEGDEAPSTAGPAPSEPITILIAGSCEVETSSINCCDDSESEPPEELTRVTWRLLRGVATEVSTRVDGPGDCVTFPSLPVDVYAVEQEVRATDGGRATKTHSNLKTGEPF